MYVWNVEMNEIHVVMVLMLKPCKCGVCSVAEYMWYNVGMMNKFHIVLINVIMDVMR